ncbi:MAG: hypothetical protein ISS36_01380 [Candidatus Aenigmarchaeota archaeon]|nr:hypothetical protein [Candidatus Aenigmarchaeota archaeon]
MKNNKCPEYSPFGNLNVVIAVGDHYRGSIKLLREAGICLYNPDEISGERLAPLTGEECRRDVKGKMVNHAPKFALFTDNPEYADRAKRVALFYPQDHPKWLERGVIDMAIGSGYDILMDESDLTPLALNGSFRTSAEEREALMESELHRAGYEAAMTLKFKPVIFNLVTKDRRFKTIADMKKYGKSIIGVTVCPHILGDFFWQKGIGGEVVEGFGAIEAQIEYGCGNVMSEVTETGKSLRDKRSGDGSEHSWWWVVDEQTGELEIVTHTEPCVIASKSGYQKEPRLIEELFETFRGNGDIGAIERLRRIHPDMFEERYVPFIKEIRDEELELLSKE